MQFGVQFFPCVSPEDKSAAAYFGECLAIAEEAEALGYSHARTVEHYFGPYGGYSPIRSCFWRRVAALRRRCGSSPARCCPRSTIR